jgi:hypothetical protein
LEDTAAVNTFAEMTHIEIDQASLEMGRQVAARLRARPELIEIARDNLARWSRQNAHSGSLLRCYAEWQEILSRPLDEVCDLLCAETDNGQRLRQNSPFVGLLSPEEVWEIKSRARHASGRS